MALEAYIQCPKCGHIYNIHKQLFDKGEEFLMYCPMCMAQFPRRDSKIISTNFASGGKQAKF